MMWLQIMTHKQQAAFITIMNVNNKLIKLINNTTLLLNYDQTGTHEHLKQPQICTLCGITDHKNTVLSVN